MKNLSAIFIGTILALTAFASDAEDKGPPMPQTRGMQGMDPKIHDTANQPAITCTPRAGTERMKHAPKDHPMPGTRGMQGMDPAQHMQDCKSSDEQVPFEESAHQHKTPG